MAADRLGHAPGEALIGHAPRRVSVVLPVVVAPILALSGCMTTHLAPLPSPCAHLSLRGGLAPARWWQGLGDTQLSALIERSLATALPPPSGQGLSAEIASRYIALRAQQTALVLLAERETLDSELVVVTRRRFGGGAAPRQTVTAAEAQLSATRADQARTRTAIEALRVRLAVLSGAALGVLDAMPGGPIPLPPVPPAGGCNAALADYRTAVAAAAHAQAEAMAARSAAAPQGLRAGAAGTLAPDALKPDRRALAALQTEERARAAMAQAYVALARSSGWAASRH